jgi:cell division protein FtsI (penicillin-binding protein 3)
MMQNGVSLPGQNRIRLLGIVFTLAFALVAGRLVQLVETRQPPDVNAEMAAEVEHVPRPDIVDRNGQVLATDIAVSSLYADPRKILDVDEAIEALTATVPDLDAKTLRQKLTQPGRAFVWLKRQVSPEERKAVYDLGLPGVGYVNERRRVYPQGRLASHVVGYVDVDTKGIAGIEKFLDDQGALYTASLAEPTEAAAAPAQLSIDMRVQYALNDEIAAAITKFGAIAGGGIVMDVRTGEIIAMTSFPDFDPNSEDKKIGKDQQNRMTSGVFELGSVIKAVTFAMALDSGAFNLNSRLDARFPLIIGNARISDFHAQHKVLTLPEVFTNSSNVGTAKMALALGTDYHRDFLRKMGLFDRLQTELPESAKPLLPRHWGKLASATAAFGHGFAVQPLQGLAVVNGLLNDGKFVVPTLLRRTENEANALATRFIKPRTSNDLRYLFRLNVEKGTAANADVLGYRVGGKTGTAEKVIHGRYNPDHRLASFIGAFPMDNPRYSIIVMLDEPNAIKGTYGFATAGWNAVPTAGKIIERIAPMLGIEPDFSESDLAKIEKLKTKEKRGG